jgi:hypothetical protein
VFWLASNDVFGRKESGKMLPDDFVGLVPEKVLRTCIPTQQVPIESDYENGIFDRIRRQQVKSLSHFLRREVVGF